MIKKEINNLPLISIITVVYNGQDSLEPTILSVINQRYSNIEYIIIDGGSTDETVNIIIKYNDKISYWISENDRGIYDAMNKALDVVTGDWVYFLGSGDVLLNVVDKIAARLINNNTVYYGDTYMIDQLKVFNGRFTKFRSSRMSICHQGIFYPYGVFKEHKYNLKYKVQGDHNLNMEIYGNKKFRFEYFPIIICIYEGGGFSVFTRDVEFFNDRLRIVKKNFPLVVYWYAYLLDKVLKRLKMGEYRILR